MQSECPDSSKVSILNADAQLNYKMDFSSKVYAHCAPRYSLFHLVYHKA